MKNRVVNGVMLAAILLPVTVFAIPGSTGEFATPNSNNLLHKAVAESDMRSVKTAVERKGYDINIQDWKGRTALLIAAKMQSSEANLAVIDYLLSHGANPDIHDKEGDTALLQALAHDRLDLAQRLIEEGKDFNSQDADGWSALIILSKTGNMDLIRKLVDKGANINAQTRVGWSALIMASAYGQTEVVKYLLDNGADRFLTTPLGQDALFFAKRKQHHEIIRLLTE